MLSLRMLVGASLAFLMGLGCRARDGQGLMASGTPSPYVIHPERATTSSELARILEMHAAEIAARMGAFSATEKSSARRTPAGKAAEELDEAVAFAIDTHGSWRGSRNNSREQGVEAWSSGGALVVRMRYGKAIRHRPEGDEAEKLRENLFGGASAAFRVIERFAQPADAGTAEVGGRRCRKIELGLAQKASAARANASSERWRSELAVDSVSGKVLLDAQTSVPVAVEINTRYHFPTKNGDVAMEMAFKRELTFDRELTVSLPPDMSLLPHRPRYEVERRELLGGL